MEQLLRKKPHKLHFEQPPEDFRGEDVQEKMSEHVDTEGIQQALVQAGVRGLIEIDVSYLNSILNLEAQIKNSTRMLELAKLGHYRPPLLDHGADLPGVDWKKVAQDTITQLSSKYQRPLLPGDPPMVERTEFPHFLELDEDIRFLIWAYALPGPRRHHFNANCKYMNPVPALLHVNRESRKLALQVFTLCDNTYIDLERDQVFCTSYKWDSFLEARNICVTRDDLLTSTSPDFLLSKFRFLKSITWYSNVTFMSTILTTPRPHFKIKINPLCESVLPLYELDVLQRIFLSFKSAFGKAGLSKTPGIFGTGLNEKDWTMDLLSKESDYNDSESVYRSCRPNMKVRPSPLKQLEPSVQAALNTMSPKVRSKLRYSRRTKIPKVRNTKQGWAA